MKTFIRALAAAAILAAALPAATAQTVLGPIPEPAKSPKAPGDYPVYVDRMIAEKNYAQALAWADEGIAKNPQNVALAFKRGVILEALGRKGDARQAYEQLIRLYPEIPEPYNNLAIIIADNGRGDLGHATELLERAITANPRFRTAHENLADIYALRALQHYRQALPLASGRGKAADTARVDRKITLLAQATGNDSAAREPQTGAVTASKMEETGKQPAQSTLFNPLPAITP